MAASLFFLLSSAAIMAETRGWVREADGRKIEAELISYDPETKQLSLAMAGGKKVVIDSSILSAEDQTYLTDHLTKRAAALESAKTGRMESFIPDNGGGHKVHIYKPPGYIDGDASNKDRPVAFLYSPGGSSQEVLDRLQPAADELGWLLVGVDAYKNTHSLEELYQERMDHSKAAFEAVADRLVFDPQKIVFGGMSGGAWWSFQSAAELTREAAGILSFGGWMGNMHEKSYAKKMAVAQVNGNADANAINYEEIDSNFLRKRASAKVKVFRFEGGHVLAPAETALEAARWIHTQKFTKK